MKKLPNNWIEVELKEICLPVETTSPTKVENPFIDYIDISSIDNRFFKIRETKPIDWGDAPSRARQKVKPGDTIFSTVRTYLKNIAKVEEGFEFPVASTGFAVIRPSSVVDEDFIFYHLISEEFINKTIERQTGASYPAIRSSEFFKLKIPLPPLAEQRRIVAKLDAALELLRAAEAALAEVPGLLEDFRRAVLHWGVTGRLTEGWRRENDIEKNTWLSTTLGEVISVKSGDGLTAKDRAEGKIPVYGGNGITGYHDKPNVNKPTIVIGRVGVYCGSIHLTPQHAWITDNAFITVFNEQKFDINFMVLLLKHCDLRSYAAENAQPVISGKRIYPTKVNIPSLAEQIKIARLVKESFEKADAFENKIKQVASELITLRQTLLRRAFRGELLTAAELAEVQGAGDYEGAGVLLERIKEEKVRMEGKMKGQRSRASISKTKKSSMKKTEDLQAVIAEKFKSKPFTFDELRQAVEPVSYEDLRRELFAILSEDAGEGQASLFDKILKINMTFNELTGKIEFTIKDK